MHRRRGFVSDDKAAAAVEFAILTPLLVCLLFGGIDVTEAVTARRKASQAANTLSDLVAQMKCVSNTDVGNNWEIAGAILAPMDPARLKARISSVVTDGGGSAKVAWSVQKNMSARGTGSTFDDLPPGLKIPNSSLVVAEVSYDYAPVVGYAITGTITMADTTFALPRVAPQSTGVLYKPGGCPNPA
jgi:Flp pilus assembly protein TadG